MPNWRSFSNSAASGQIPSSKVALRTIVLAFTFKALASRSGGTPRLMARLIIKCS